MDSSLNSLYPVILSVPDPYPEKLTGPERLALMRRYAREALYLSAKESNLILGPLVKDERGAPVPSHGVYWSISHKTRCVSAVAGTQVVGIDVEELLPRSTQQLFTYLATPEEWQLFSPCPTWDLFYRYWTAKESAIKATGEGIKDLKTCKVIAIPDEKHLILNYAQRLWTVEHHWYKNHIISVIADNKRIIWIEQ